MIEVLQKDRPMASSMGISMDFPPPRIRKERTKGRRTDGLRGLAFLVGSKPRGFQSHRPTWGGYCKHQWTRNGHHSIHKQIRYREDRSGNQLSRNRLRKRHSIGKHSLFACSACQLGCNQWLAQWWAQEGPRVFRGVVDNTPLRSLRILHRQ